MFTFRCFLIQTYMTTWITPGRRVTLPLLLKLTLCWGWGQGWGRDISGKTANQSHNKVRRFYSKVWGWRRMGGPTSVPLPVEAVASCDIIHMNLRIFLTDWNNRRQSYKRNTYLSENQACLWSNTLVKMCDVRILKWKLWYFAVITIIDLLYGMWKINEINILLITWGIFPT